MSAATMAQAMSVELVSTYDRDVLQLKQGQLEHELDALLRTQTKELGLSYDMPKGKGTAHTPHSEDSSRCSTSVDSAVSISTGITSAWSRDRISIYSNDTHGYPRSMRSLTTDDLPKRQSISSSTFSASTTSTGGSHKSAFQRFKSLGMRLHKSSRSELKCCPHCPRDTASQRRALHELPCGHRLCTQALRNIVIEAMRQQILPMCCREVLPGRFIRHVLSDEELKACEQQHKPVELPIQPLSRCDSARLPALVEDKPVLPQHAPELARFDAWVSKSRTTLHRQRSDMLQILQEQHQKALDEQLEAQAIDMTIAEDRQVKAEADLRILQQQEVRDNATALKHMGAYCAGHLSNGELHNRTITEQDMRELQKTQVVRDSMQHKHNNAINILRGEQTRRMRVRAQRHDKDLHLLQARQRKEILAFEQRHRAEAAAFDADCATKKERLQYRWELQDMIRAKQACDHTLRANTIEGT